jgi:hypothetical protein
MKHVSLENISYELENIRNLILLHSDYFMRSKEYVEKKPYVLICRYSEHSALVHTIINLIDNAQISCNIAEEYYKNLHSTTSSS